MKTVKVIVEITEDEVEELGSYLRKQVAMVRICSANLSATDRLLLKLLKAHQAQNATWDDLMRFTDREPDQTYGAAD